MSFILFLIQFELYCNINIKIPHKNYGYIPIEIAVDLFNIDYDYYVKVFNRSDFIKILKNDLLLLYKNYYKDIHDTSIKKTFILLTKRLYEKLEYVDKTYCKNYKGLF